MSGGSLPMRPYQFEAVKAVEAAHARKVRRPAVVLPTGTGKTVVIAHMVKRQKERPFVRGGKRSLIAAHRDELLEQAAAKIHDVAPELSVGIVKANRNETRADVVIGSVQTLRNEQRRRMITDVGLVIIDEAHHAPADSYLRLLGHYGCWEAEGYGRHADAWPDAKAVGFTATMLRGDQKSLGDVWQEVVYTRSISEMVAAGYLTRPRGIRVYVDDLNLAAVKRSRGDYSAGDLGRAIEESQMADVVVKAVLEHCPKDPGIVFTPTVETARIQAAAMKASGLRVEMVWGDMAMETRRSILADYKAGKIDWLVNPQLLTEGTDLPRAKVCVIARPTRSAGLFIQMAGRVLRPYPGKSEAILLDVVGATAEHSLHARMQLFGEEAAALTQEREDDAQRDDVELDDDGEELLAAASREIGPPVWSPAGPIVSEEVDLFHGSTSAWARTNAGVWFLAASERLIAIVPGREPDTWDVVSMHAREPGTGRWVIQGLHEMAYAMAWAEGDVTPAEKRQVAREQSWQHERSSLKQRQLAERLGIAVPRGKTTKGEVAALLNVAGASHRIDPYIPAYARVRL